MNVCNEKNSNCLRQQCCCCYICTDIVINVVTANEFCFLLMLHIGIFFYFLASGVLGLYYMLIRSQSDSLHFMNKQQLITGFVFENLFTYILMWTLIYGCVHVYWRRTRWCRKRNLRNYFIYYRTVLLRVVYLISFQN